MKIALAGVGLMGHGLGSRLIGAGHALTVLAHRNRQPIEDLVARGAREAPDALSLAKDQELVILCLPNSDVVEKIIAEMRPSLARGMIILDMGTSEPSSNQRLAVELGAIGVEFAESQVTGGPGQAATGQLGGMVGAEPALFDKLLPIISVMCGRISHMGPVGTGSAAKLINNFLSTSFLAAITETYQAATCAGIDWAKLYNVMQQGSMNSPALQRMIEPALSGRHDGFAFSIGNAAKDIRYFNRLAADIGMESFLAADVQRFYEKAVASGLAEKNISELLNPASKG